MAQLPYLSVIDKYAAPCLQELSFRRDTRTKFSRRGSHESIARFSFRSEPRFLGTEVSFQAMYDLVVPAVYEARHGRPPATDEHVDFSDNVLHTWRDGDDLLDVVNIWQFDLPDSPRIPEFEAAMRETAERLVAVSDDLRLLVDRDPVDPFRGPYDAQRNLIETLLESVD